MYFFLLLQNNRDPIECPLCPGDQKTAIGGEHPVNELICPEFHGSRNCWNSYTCQKSI